MKSKSLSSESLKRNSDSDEKVGLEGDVNDLDDIRQSYFLVREEELGE